MKYNYYDFAENDYQYILFSYQNGGVWNSMCAIAQQTCERYMKHLIDVYYDPSDEAEAAAKISILRKHNLDRLEKFLKKDMHIEIDKETHLAMLEINGYYYSTKYPGDESFFADEEDVKKAVDAVKMCKEFTDRAIFLLEGKRQERASADLEEERGRE